MNCIVCGKSIEIDYEIHVNDCLDKSIEESKKLEDEKKKEDIDEGFLVLTDCQKKALEYSYKKAKIFEKNTRANVEIKLIKVGFCENDFVKLKEYIKACEVTINFPVSVLKCLIKDKYIKNAYETNKSSSYLIYRTTKEDVLFNKNYVSAMPEERVKYGAINILHEKDGITSTKCYGSCILVLKNKLKKRITFVNGNSQASHVYICTFDNFMHFFLHSDEHFMGNVLKRMNGEECDYNIPYTEVQIHGDILLNRDIEKLMIPNSEYNTNKSSLDEFEKTFPTIKICKI
uniref:Uncharacterized protein n=1 Tax=viral metagenome TaxID=1070528 RepID=A0A6C0EB59_9ZZZZ